MRGPAPITSIMILQCQQISSAVNNWLGHTLTSVAPFHLGIMSQSGGAETPKEEQKVNDDVPVPKAPMQDMDEDISHPTLELYRHTLLRGANLGSVVSLIIGPPYLLFKGVRCPMEFTRRLGSFTAKGMAIGIAFGAISTYLRIRNDADEQIYDRCYRLRHNVGQIRTDKFTYGGFLVGGAAGAVGLASQGVVAGSVHGASMGAGLAVLAHVLTKSKEKKD